MFQMPSLAVGVYGGMASAMSDNEILKTTANGIRNSARSQA